MTDREKVIKGLESLHDRLCDAAKQDAIATLDASTVAYALALLKEQDWHFLTEDSDGVIHGLPGDDGRYLMMDGEDIWIDDYVDGVDDGIILDSGADIREIVAWMYMPELPNRR